jgi:hypothetical protein
MRRSTDEDEQMVNAMPFAGKYLYQFPDGLVMISSHYKIYTTNCYATGCASFASPTYVHVNTVAPAVAVNTLNGLQKVQNAVETPGNLGQL